MSFTLFADCAVVYDGRAFSVLDRGNYLLIHKDDGTLLIHGARLTKPLNYQGPKTAVTWLRGGPEFEDLCASLFEGGEDIPNAILVGVNKAETITIAVYQELARIESDKWSENKIKLVGKESELVAKLVAGLQTYLPDVSVRAVEREVQTPYGSIDVVIEDESGVFHLIEAKRKIASVSACGQIARYAKYFKDSLKRKVTEYIAAPAITKNATRYAEQYGQTFIKITW
jgi:RecB family endonuclease NucS